MTENVCQCPTRALSHFYEDPGSGPWYQQRSVSMPYTGFKSFLRYPSKNGLFPPFFRGSFADIFQNILINVVSVYYFDPVHILFINFKKA